jgi:HSP20 family protein
MCKVSSSLHFVRQQHPSNDRETAAGTSWSPNTDVYLMDGGVVIKVELAGMRREDLELTVEGNRLKISGQRPDGCRPSKCSFIVMEINYGAFESVIELPEGYDLNQAKAAYQNGFLRIDVPQQKRPASKNISVLVSDAQ